MFKWEGTVSLLNLVIAEFLCFGAPVKLQNIQQSGPQPDLDM